MTEAIAFSIGAVSLAALLGSFNAWLERKSEPPFRQRVALAIAHWCCAWVAGDRARIAAKAEARAMAVDLRAR